MNTVSFDIFRSEDRFDVIVYDNPAGTELAENVSDLGEAVGVAQKWAQDRGFVNIERVTIVSSKGD